MTKEIYTTKKERDILSVVANWCESKIYTENCGLIGKKDDCYHAILTENKSSEPEQTFLIDPLEYLFFIEEYEPIAVFHSHISGNEEPSEKDIVMSENSCLPFFIYSLNTKNFHFYIPKKTKVDVNILDKFKKSK